MIFFSSERTFRRIINHWKKTGCVSNKENLKQNKINIYQKKRFQTFSNDEKRLSKKKRRKKMKNVVKTFEKRFLTFFFGSCKFPQ